MLGFAVVILLSSLRMMSQGTQPSRCAAAVFRDCGRLYAGRDQGWTRRILRPNGRRRSPVVFCSDWQGKNPDEQRETQVRVLWSSQTLYLRFECRYRELYLFDGLRSQWPPRPFVGPRRGGSLPAAGSVAGAILPRVRSEPQRDVDRSRYLSWRSSGSEERPEEVRGVGREGHRWTAELAIPLKALTPNFDPKAIWRANFYRVEGKKEPRTYMAWQPTGSPEPNFHVPSAFGRLRFAEAGE